MIYTRLGALVALVAMVVGVMLFVCGMLIATESVGPYEETLARYFPRASSSGQIIDKGMYYTLFGIAFGILTEIAANIAKLPTLLKRDT
jgi:hypothetical protein